MESINPEPSRFPTEVRPGPGDQSRLQQEAVKLKGTESAHTSTSPGHGWGSDKDLLGCKGGAPFGDSRGQSGGQGQGSRDPRSCPHRLPGAKACSHLLLSRDPRVRPSPGFPFPPPTSAFLFWLFWWKEAPETQRVGVPGLEGRWHTTDALLLGRVPPRETCTLKFVV